MKEPVLFNKPHDGDKALGFYVLGLELALAIFPVFQSSWDAGYMAGMLAS